jgi:integrase
MKDLIVLMENKKLSDTTIKNYIRRLYILNGKKKFSSLTFLRKHEDIIKYLKENYSVGTQKSYAGTILSVLKLKPSKINNKLSDIYNSFINDEDIEKYNKTKTEKSEKQEQNWISQEEVMKVKSELEKQALSIYKKPSLSIKEYNTLLQNALLSFYTNLPPRRAADYALMKFSNDTGDKKFNYFTDKDKLIFHNYKTSKTYGTQEQDISKNKSLLKDLKMYLKHRKPSKTDLLFVKANGVDFNTINDITRTMNSIFGKKISTNMLRSIYVSDKYGELKQGMIEDAEKMGHSVDTQQNQYNKGK